MKSLVAEIESRGGRAQAQALDITQAQQVDDFAQELRREFGRVDILVNSADASFIGSLEATTEVD